MFRTLVVITSFLIFASCRPDEHKSSTKNEKTRLSVERWRDLPSEKLIEDTSNVLLKMGSELGAVIRRTHELEYAEIDFDPEDDFDEGYFKSAVNVHYSKDLATLRKISSQLQRELARFGGARDKAEDVKKYAANVILSLITDFQIYSDEIKLARMGKYLPRVDEELHKQADSLVHEVEYYLSGR